MKIRAITAFSEIHENDTETPLARAATFLHAATYHFQHSGVKVQSRRIATQPFPQMSLSRGPVGVPALAARLREQCTAYGIDYLGLGPVGAADDPDYVDALPEIFGTAPGIFASIDIASPAQGIDLGLLRHSAGQL